MTAEHRKFGAKKVNPLMAHVWRFFLWEIWSGNKTTGTDDVGVMSIWKAFFSEKKSQVGTPCKKSMTMTMQISHHFEGVSPIEKLQ